MELPCGTSTGGAHSKGVPWMAVTRWTCLGVLVVDSLVAGGLILLALFGWVEAPIPSGQTAAGQTAAGQSRLPDRVALDILPVKPGGPAEDYAAYVPSTVLRVPASSLVTITIRNFDLDATPLPGGSPYARVQGTMGGVAYADGKAYGALACSAIAHTFTVPALHLNVPIPGRAAAGKRYVTVTFRVRTGNAGAYEWRCFAPCGDGPDGQAGPMADERYMRGTLVVEG